MTRIEFEQAAAAGWMVEHGSLLHLVGRAHITDHGEIVIRFRQHGELMERFVDPAECTLVDRRAGR